MIPYEGKDAWLETWVTQPPASNPRTAHVEEDLLCVALAGRAKSTGNSCRKAEFGTIKTLQLLSNSNLKIDRLLLQVQCPATGKGMD